MSTGPLLGLDLDRAGRSGSRSRSSVRALIRSELLAGRRRLPSTRALAADLGVSRGVVVCAYAQLAAEGVYRAPPRRRAARRALRAVQPSRSTLEPDVPIARARSTSDLTCRTSRSSRAPSGSAACRRSLERAANATSPTASRSGQTGCGANSRRSSRGRAGSSATSGRIGIFAGSTQALLVLGVGPPRGRRGPRSPSRIPVTAGARACSPRRARDRPGPGRRARSAGRRARRTSTPSSSAPTTSSRRASSLVTGAAACARRVGGSRRSARDRARLRRATSATTAADAGALQGLAPEHVAYVGSASAAARPRRAARLGRAAGAAGRPGCDAHVHDVACAPRGCCSLRSPS